MPMLGLLLTLFIVVAALSGTESLDSHQVSVAAEYEAIAGNMLVYRGFVSQYAVNNPTVSGAISDSALGLPSWFIRSQYLSNYVAAGKSYVFYSAFVPGLASSIADTTASMNVGTNSGGMLNSPGKGQTGIVLPSQVPQSSVVIIQ